MKSPISHAPLIRRRVMTEPDAGPSNEEPDVMTTTAEVHPARIVAEIRANDGRQPGPREAEDGEDAPRDSGADGDESPSSPSPTLAPLADDERSSGGSLGDDEDDVRALGHGRWASHQSGLKPDSRIGGPQRS